MCCTKQSTKQNKVYNTKFYNEVYKIKYIQKKKTCKSEAADAARTCPKMCRICSQRSPPPPFTFFLHIFLFILFVVCLFGFPEIASIAVHLFFVYLCMFLFLIVYMYIFLLFFVNLYLWFFGLFLSSHFCIHLKFC